MQVLSCTLGRRPRSHLFFIHPFLLFSILASDTPSRPWSSSSFSLLLLPVSPFHMQAALWVLERTWVIQGTSLLLHRLQYYESISFNVSSANKLSPCLHLWLGNQKTSKGSVSSKTLLLWSFPICKILDMNLFWLVYTTTNNKWQN